MVFCGFFLEFFKFFNFLLMSDVMFVVILIGGLISTGFISNVMVCAKNRLLHFLQHFFGPPVTVSV